ncbi:MAG: glutamine--tRNA ligase/YqeY domain fusion protein [Bacteroidales bacterium]|nr:glutamine--tRNA ligase/YqeY domain fusion protein [Bacteroidales bacterium]
MNTNKPPVPDAPSKNFVEEIIDADLASGRFTHVQTRFPPEPNGYLHLGHAKSICLNYGLAMKYGGKFNLRFDDTNPTTEDTEYVDAIREDVRWLGADWEGREFYASDYFDQLYTWAEKLIQEGKAFVCDLTNEQMAEYRGDIKGGKPSPFRDRTPEENLDLFRRMKAGEFPDGSRTLRAKIDVNHPNFHLRDPVMYRILHAHHHRTGDKWCIYPMYDYAHGESDSIEGITHSICTLEFEIHRPLYDWYVQAIGIYQPRQIEFARLNLTYTVLSKRRLIQLVNEKHVSGWDDPRMPTLCGVRRRGYTPESLRKFCERIGVSKFNGIIDVTWLEDALREDLNKKAPRAMAVLHPLKVVIENYPDGQTEELDAVNNPEDPTAGTRKIPFSNVLYIERDDFLENPPKDFFRLGPGREVRLRYAYFFQCTGFTKDPISGEITEIRGTIDPDTRGGNDPPVKRKVKGTIHWVSAAHAVDAEVRLYDHLFNTPDPDDVPEGQTYLSNLNPLSLTIVEQAKLEPALASTQGGDTFQFERLGYFCRDRDSTPERPVFNRTVTLRDTWAKMQKKKA